MGWALILIADNANSAIKNYMAVIFVGRLFKCFTEILAYAEIRFMTLLSPYNF